MVVVVGLVSMVSVVSNVSMVAMVESPVVQHTLFCYAPSQRKEKWKESRWKT